MPRKRKDFEIPIATTSRRRWTKDSIRFIGEELVKWSQNEEVYALFQFFITREAKRNRWTSQDFKYLLDNHRDDFYYYHFLARAYLVNRLIKRAGNRYNGKLLAMPLALRYLMTYDDDLGQMASKMNIEAAKATALTTYFADSYAQVPLLEPFKSIHEANEHKHTINASEIPAEAVSITHTESPGPGIQEGSCDPA